MAKTTKERPQLGRDVLIARALELADTEGLESVTVRRLAQEFEVTPMALYWHFRNKDELLTAMGDEVLGAVVVPAAGDLAPAAGRPEWSERLQSIVTSLVTAFRAHPSVAPLAAQQIMMSTSGLDLTEETLALLRSVGFTSDDAATVAHHALMTALMLVSGEPGAEGQVGGAEAQERRAAKTASLQALPPDRYPNLLESFGALMSCADEDWYYNTGVEIFVAGVRGLLASRLASGTLVP